MTKNNLGKTPSEQIPLLLWNTKVEKITDNVISPSLNYDYINQIVEYDCQTVGTKCFKSTMGKAKNGVSKPDNKNEIDDSKMK